MFPRVMRRHAAACSLLAVLSLLAGCDYGRAVAKNVAFGVRDCVQEAGLSGCIAGADPVELFVGALINGALFGPQ